MKNIKAQIADIVYKLNPKFYYQIRYLNERHELADFKVPNNLSEYLLSEMLKPDFKKYAVYADKIEVRKYIEKKGLEYILPKCYGIWNNANEIPFESLPMKFALKTNHGCGNHIICKDKNKINIEKVISTLNKTVSQIFSIREPHYKYISPKIFAEEFIDDNSGALPIDYKFMCVNGEPKCILVCSDRDKNSRPMKAAYSLDWEKLDWIIHDIDLNERMKPKHLKEMIEIARILSSDFEFVRVDLYDCPEKIFFGELTFSPASGLMGYFSKKSLELMNPKRNK